MIHVIKNRSAKWWLGITSGALLFVVIAFFTYAKMGFVLKGVNLTANIDTSGSGSLVTVAGKAYGATFVTLNGREIFIDKDGTFKEPIVLLPGLSVVKLDTQDAFGNTSEKKFELVYNEANGSVAINR